MSDVIVAPNVRDLDDLAKSLTGWLTGKMSEARGLSITSLTYPRGAGQSHETILFDAQWTQDGAPASQGFVVRIKPTSFVIYPDDLFDQQYQVLRALHEDGQVRVAKPFWIEHDPAILGAPFFIMEKMVGRVPVSIPPYSESGWVFDSSPAQRRVMWESGVRQLAATQLVPLEKLPFLKGPAHAPHGLEQEWDKFTRFIEWLAGDGPVPVLEAAHARLKSLWPANRPEGMVWGDSRLGNMMFDENYQVIAVMDWEQPSLGGALNDLAWFVVSAQTWHSATDTRPYLEGMGSDEETIAMWEELTGKSAADLDWYIDFTHLKMACLGTRMGRLRGSTMMDEKAMAERLKVG